MEFHVEIMELCEPGFAFLVGFGDLPHLRRVHREFRLDVDATVLRGRVELGKYPMKPKPDALDAHDAVADAIAKGEPERARSAMLDIVDEVARALNFF